MRVGLRPCRQRSQIPTRAGVYDRLSFFQRVGSYRTWRVESASRSAGHCAKWKRSSAQAGGCKGEGKIKSRLLPGDLLVEATGAQLFLPELLRLGREAVDGRGVMCVAALVTYIVTKRFATNSS